MQDFPKRSVILGGAASGKSEFAESLARAAGLEKLYLATAQALDDEMAAKIDAHRASRAQDGWRTIEEPLDLAGVLSTVRAGQVVLIDCASLWLSNLMGAGRDPQAEWRGLLAGLARCNGPVIIVSNEVGLGIVPDNALARAFRQAQGEMNRALVGTCDLAVMVVAGAPLVLRGRLPDGVVPW